MPLTRFLTLASASSEVSELPISRYDTPRLIYTHSYLLNPPKALTCNDAGSAHPNLRTRSQLALTDAPRWHESGGAFNVSIWASASSISNECDRVSRGLDGLISERLDNTHLTKIGACLTCFEGNDEYAGAQIRIS